MPASQFATAAREPLPLSLLVFSVAGGLLHAGSMSWPGSGTPVWWLQVLSLAALCWSLQRAASWRRAALVGWLFATAWLAGSFWWLFISMHEHGGLSAPLAGLGVLVLAALLASYYGLAAALFAAGTRGSPLRDALLFAALWLGAELARGTFITGFPWAAAGYAHVDGPLRTLAPWLGVYGISAFAALSAFLLSLLPQATARARSGYRFAAVACVAVVGALGWTANQTSFNVRPQGAPLRVALFQGNIPQQEKFDVDTGIPLALDWYRQAMSDAGADLLVLPETALPLLPQDLPDGYLSELHESLSAAGHAALVGMPLGSLEKGYTNSVLGLGMQANEYRYDKHHLVPFGEFSPAMLGWLPLMMNIPLGDFERGGLAQRSFAWRGQRLAPNICYEDLFGEELAVRFRDPASAPTILVNLSNIAWFGNTLAIDQHLHISRMRAMEFGRPVVRATNTGATAAIDAGGRVTAMLPRHTRGVLLAEVQGATGTTPFAWWSSRFGVWPLWMLVFAAPWLTRARK